MPEGDVVWLTARRLHDALASRVMRVAELRVPRFATADLTGRRVNEVIPRGKHLLTRIEGGLTLHTHLRMDGEWHLYRAGTRPRGGPAWQIRALLGNDAWLAVGYRLGIVELLRTEDEARAVGHLGPDLLGPDWDLAEAVRRLSADAERPIGEALLDQRNLAGIGNLYKSEVLFLRGVSPWRPVGGVTELPPTVEYARRLLHANKEGPGQVTTGVARRGESTWVYGRAGRPCRRCGSPIERAAQGGEPYERVTFWCPHCQT
ncbi:MAG: DNA glycosylase [Streptosporangiales bacterium]|nr:DNA glycosylase [Streptosporangiales bacterium]